MNTQITDRGMRKWDTALHLGGGGGGVIFTHTVQMNKRI